MEIVNWVLANKVEVGVALLAILGAFSAIAKITPTKSDDAVIDFIYKVVHTLGLSK